MRDSDFLRCFRMFLEDKMMKRIIALLLCTVAIFAFCACNNEPSDKDEVATVERVYTARINGAELDFILIASGTKMPLKKILKKLDYKAFEYEGGQDEKSGFDSKP